MDILEEIDSVASQYETDEFTTIDDIRSEERRVGKECL